MLVLDGKPHLSGGVTCNQTLCYKLDSVYVFNHGSTDKSTGSWSLVNENLNIPRSSHVAVQAPISYFSECSENVNVTVKIP